MVRKNSKSDLSFLERQKEKSVEERLSPAQTHQNFKKVQ